MKVQTLNFTKNISQSAEMMFVSTTDNLQEGNNQSCIQQSCSRGCCVCTVGNQSSAKHSSRLTLQVDDLEPGLKYRPNKEETDFNICILNLETKVREREKEEVGENKCSLSCIYKNTNAPWRAVRALYERRNRQMVHLKKETVVTADSCHSIKASNLKVLPNKFMEEKQTSVLSFWMKSLKCCQRACVNLGRMTFTPHQQKVRLLHTET